MVFVSLFIIFQYLQWRECKGWLSSILELGWVIQGQGAIHDMVVKSVVFEIQPRGRNGRLALQEADAALRHVEIVDDVQMDRAWGLCGMKLVLEMKES